MSEFVLIAVSVAVVAAAAAALWARRRFGAMFGPAHVRVFVDRIDSLRSAALDRFDAPFVEGDPRATVTRAGLAVAYTLSSEGEAYRHHLSVSHVGGHTTHAVGARFLLLGVRRLRLDDVEIGLGVGPTGAHHAQWVLDAEQQARFVDRRPPALDDARLAAEFAACFEEAGQVHFERLSSEAGGGAG